MSKGKGTLLILDDNEIVRECLVCLFQDRDWHVLQAETAEQGLEIIKATEVDGAVVDMRLPGMDGNEFIRRALIMRPHLTFIICAGSPEFDVDPDVAALTAVGAVLSKPVESLVALERTMHEQVDAVRKGTASDV